MGSHYKGVEVTLKDGTTFVADAAVVVIPLGVLKAKSIKFESKLPDWKEEAKRMRGSLVPKCLDFLFLE